MTVVGNDGGSLCLSMLDDWGDCVIQVAEMGLVCHHGQPKIFPLGRTPLNLRDTLGAL